jgi:hypothetical protein
MQANSRDGGWSSFPLPIHKKALGHAQELARHIFYQDQWVDYKPLHWWVVVGISCEDSPNQKALATLTMLVSWTIWKEMNTRVKIIKPHRWPFSLRLSRAKQNFGLPWVLSIWVLYHWESNPVGNLFFVFVFGFVPLNSQSYLMNGGESFATFKKNQRWMGLQNKKHMHAYSKLSYIGVLSELIRSSWACTDPKD